MQKFDSFSKALPEFQVKTKQGGYISLLSIVIIAYLLLSEIMYFLDVEQKDEMIVDFEQDRKTFDSQIHISLPDLPCAVVGLNVVHVKNSDNVMHVGHNILKQRILTENGGQTKRGLPIRSGLHRIASSSGEFNDNLNMALGQKEADSVTHSTRRIRCASCYGVKSDEDECCNTCETLERAFTKQGWSMPTDHLLEQCAPKQYRTLPPLSNEGCLLQATLRAKKIPAILQIGLAYDFDKTLLHESFRAKAAKGYISFTHSVQKLTFGPDFPGFQPVLDGLTQKHEHVPLVEGQKDEQLESQSEHWQYDVHLIPTEYVSPFGRVTDSHQYSATHYVKGINVSQRHRDLPPAGIFFKFEFTPFKVRWVFSYKSFTHFLTNICAILGGIYAFFGMIDSLLYQAVCVQNATSKYLM